MSIFEKKNHIELILMDLRSFSQFVHRKREKSLKGAYEEIDQIVGDLYNDMVDGVSFQFIFIIFHYLSFLRII